MSLDLRRYLDCAATTPVAPEVQAEIQRVEREAWANPASLQGLGRAAAEQLERSRDQIASLLGCSGQVVFTSGGSESIHLALLGSAGAIADQQGTPPRLLLSAVEHPASEAAALQLQRLGWTVERIPVDRWGLIDLGALGSLLTRPTQLVSLIWGQSEVGALQPIQEIGALCRSAGVLLHVDAVQVAAQRPIAFDALPIDLMSVASHKLSGPRGIAALLVRDGVQLQPIQAGGGQERGLRSGTEPVALIAGFAAALERLHALRFKGDADPMTELRDRLLSALPLELIQGHPIAGRRHFAVLFPDDLLEDVAGLALLMGTGVLQVSHLHLRVGGPAADLHGSLLRRRPPWRLAYRPLRQPRSRWGGCAPHWPVASRSGGGPRR